MGTHANKLVNIYETCQCMIMVNDEMVTAKFCSFLMVLQHMDARCIFLQNSLTSILKGLCCPGLLKLPLTPNGYTCKHNGVINGHCHDL